MGGGASDYDGINSNPKPISQRTAEICRIMARRAVERIESEVSVYAPAVGVVIDIGDRFTLTNSNVPKKFQGCIFEVVAFTPDGGTTLRVVD